MWIWISVRPCATPIGTSSQGGHRSSSIGWAEVVLKSPNLRTNRICIFKSIIFGFSPGQSQSKRTACDRDRDGWIINEPKDRPNQRVLYSSDVSYVAVFPWPSAFLLPLAHFINHHSHAPNLLAEGFERWVYERTNSIACQVDHP